MQYRKTLRLHDSSSSVRAMAITERIEMNPMMPNSATSLDNDFIPGLRVMARTTTSSLPDYPEWNLSDLQNHPDRVVTDGACS